MENKTIGLIIMILGVFWFLVMLYFDIRTLSNDLVKVGFNQVLSLLTGLVTPATFFLIGLFISKHDTYVKA